MIYSSKLKIQYTEEKQNQKQIHTLKHTDSVFLYTKSVIFISISTHYLHFFFWQILHFKIANNMVKS